MTAAVFTINTPWPFVAVLLAAFVAVLLVLVIEGRD